MAYVPKKGDRVTWRGKPGEVVDDYWSHRDRFSVRFDGDCEPLDFGAEALRLVSRNPAPFDLNVPDIPPTISGRYNCAGAFRPGPTAAEVAARAMRAKLDAAALEVLRAGDSWGEGPYEFPAPSWHEVQGLLSPPMLTVTCRGGAVPHDWVPPEGWRMIRHSDWVAAGRPGLRP